MAKRIESQQPVRRSFLVVGGLAIAAAVLGFVLMNFVMGGGDAEQVSTQEGPATVVQTPAPADPVAPPALEPGGRDPFRPVINISTPPPPEPAPIEAAPAPQSPGAEEQGLE